MTKFAIVLVTYNGWQMTRECLLRLFAQTHRDFRIIVVDNASSDGTPQKIAQEFPLVQCIALLQNVGFGAANNIGVEHVLPNEYVLLLNNDTLPNADFLERICAHKSVLENQGVYAPKALNRDGSLQVSYYHDISLLRFLTLAFKTENQAKVYLHGKLRHSDFADLNEVDWTSAICWCMSLQTWHKVGGFDKRIFMYYEDVDFAWRARALGVRFYIAIQDSLVHLGGGSAVSSVSRSLQHDTAQEYVYKKRWGFRGLVASKIFRFVRSLLRICVLLPLSISSAATTKRNSLKVHWNLFKNVFYTNRDKTTIYQKSN